MTQEIIYTSAPQGLRPGSFGFCTVSTTPGMATSLAERLEALSGYRHAYPPGHASAINNPVVFSHLLLKVGGQRLHVLSRIADAGLDYSQRTNKLAHHVALEVNELVPGGPAWVLAQPHFAETKWSGSPRVMAAGRKPPTGNLAHRVCHAWQRAAGDAGWAGVLAQHALDSKRPAFLIFPEGLDVLPLLVEAQSLLPPMRRWDVSFSTYFTRLPTGVECLWRCVLGGSPEANTAAGLRGETVIDLTQPLGPAPVSPLVRAARTGQLLTETPIVGGPPSVADMLSLDESDEPPQMSARFRLSHEGDVRLAPPPVKSSLAFRTPLPSEGANVPPRRAQSRLIGLVISLSAAVVVLLSTSITFCVLYLQARRNLRQLQPPVAHNPAEPASQPHQSSKEQLIAVTTAKPVATPLGDSSAQSKIATDEKDSGGGMPAVSPDLSKPTTSNADAPPRQNIEDKTAEVNDAGKPAIDAADKPKDGSQGKPAEQPTAPEPAFKPRQLGLIPRSIPLDAKKDAEKTAFIEVGKRLRHSDIELELIGREGLGFSLECTQNDAPNLRAWLIKSKATVQGLASSGETPIAEISTQDTNDTLTLIFKWLPQARTDLKSRNVLLSSALLIRRSSDSEATEPLKIGAPLRLSAVRVRNLQVHENLLSSEKRTVSNSNDLDPFDGIHPQTLKLDNARLLLEPTPKPWHGGHLHICKQELNCPEHHNLHFSLEFFPANRGLIGMFYHKTEDARIDERFLRQRLGNIEQLNDIDKLESQAKDLEDRKKAAEETKSGAPAKESLLDLKSQLKTVTDKLAELNPNETRKTNADILDRDYRNTLGWLIDFLGMTNGDSQRAKLKTKGDIKLCLTITRIVGTLSGKEVAIPLVEVTDEGAAHER